MNGVGNNGGVGNGGAGNGGAGDRGDRDDVSTVEIEMDEKSADEILEEGIMCSAEVEIGEVIDCILKMFQHIQRTGLVQGFKMALGPGNEQNVDKFLFMLLVSEVATITNNFKKREKETAKA